MIAWSVYNYSYSNSLISHYFLRCCQITCQTTCVSWRGTRVNTALAGSSTGSMTLNIKSAASFGTAAVKAMTISSLLRRNVQTYVWRHVRHRNPPQHVSENNSAANWILMTKTIIIIIIIIIIVRWPNHTSPQPPEIQVRQQNLPLPTTKRNTLVINS